MTSEEKEKPVAEIMTVKTMYSVYLDKATEEKVDEAVTNILVMDDRFSNPDIETIDAIRDWVRAEAVLSKAFHKFMTGDTTASTERMYRHASLHKNSLREEIFKRFKGRRAKKEEIDFANTILIESGVIEPKTEVDILADRKT